MHTGPDSRMLTPGQLQRLHVITMVAGGFISLREAGESPQYCIEQGNGALHTSL